jgi:hypothetical protein
MHSSLLCTCANPQMQTLTWDRWSDREMLKTGRLLRKTRKQASVYTPIKP